MNVLLGLGCGKGNGLRIGGVRLLVQVYRRRLHLPPAEDQPFRPLRAMDSVNCFWVKKYRTRIGMMVIKAPAIM